MYYALVTVIFCMYVHFQYTESLRARWFWLAAPMIACVAHWMWAMLCRAMSSETAVYVSAFWYWNLFVHAPLLVVPLVFYGVQIKPLGIVGAVLVAIGLAFFHFGTSH